MLLKPAETLEGYTHKASETLVTTEQFISYHCHAPSSTSPSSCLHLPRTKSLSQTFFRQALDPKTDRSSKRSSPHHQLLRSSRRKH